MNSFAFVKEVALEYIKDNGSLVAAAVAFYMFLSLIPLLLLGVAGVGYLLGSPGRAEKLLFDYLGNYSPALAEQGGALGLGEVVRGVVSGRGAATGLGLVFLLWSGTSAIVMLEQAVNVAWNCTLVRPFWLKRLLAVAMLFIGGGMFGVSFASTAALERLRHTEQCLLGICPGRWSGLWNLTAYLLPLAITILGFTLAYKILPRVSVPTRSAVFGGLLAGVLWEAAKIGFSYYLNNYAGYNRVYGSLTSIILLMVWINYSAIVAILGAEAASVWARHHSREVNPVEQ